MAETNFPLSEVGIANMAAVLIGERRILTFDDSGKFAQIMSQQFGFLRDEVLQSHPWVFNKARIALAEDTAAPAFGWDYSYEVPADFLSVRRLTRDGRKGSPEIRHEREGTSILTNQPAPLCLVYSRRITTPSKFPPLFAGVLAARIAVHCAMDVVGKTAYLGAARQALTDAIYLATHNNALDDDDPENYAYTDEDFDVLSARGHYR